MLNLLKQLRRDEYGVILSAEIVIVGSLLVVGLITGVSCLQRSVDGELRDLGNAIGSLDQSYSFVGHYKPPTNGKCCAWTAGSSYRNCETAHDACQDELVGVTDCCQAIAVGCGQCGSSGCGGCVSSTAGCGKCGGGGCSGSCGTGAGTTGARCIDSGVPKMKITEWPSVSVHSNSGAIVPVAENQAFGAGVASRYFSDGSTSVISGGPCNPVGSGDIIIPDHVW